jgi:hypothetical protein
MRAATGLHPDDALGFERVISDQKLGVFPGVDVVGHNGHFIVFTHGAAKRQRECGFARTDRSSDADS